MKNHKKYLIVLIIMNSIVLLGQIWPEGAPPFATLVNIATLIFNLMMFTAMIRNFRLSNFEK